MDTQLASIKPPDSALPVVSVQRDDANKKKSNKQRSYGCPMRQSVK
ncbi:hypothetical protein Q2T70_26445 [Klebsiella oxytoca]|nr:hypothetical protein [Klebsiella oxytoca]WKM71856.1 hypothetical protein Q2T70_26445 [Klebsiella oxytoca]